MPLLDGADERVGRDPASPPIDERVELPRAGTRVAPVPKHHRNRRAPAHRLGLREIRDLECDRGTVRWQRRRRLNRLRRRRRERERDDQR